jgi:collagen type II alpha
MGQGNTKGPDPLSSDQPVRVFGDELTQDQQRQMVIQAYKKLKETFEEFNKPNGDQKTPAKTCKDLKMAHPDTPSGDYWVDPNSGDPKDAILAYCNMENESTCIYPKPDVTEETTSDTPEREIWFSDIPGVGFDLTYKADSNQITFLQMLSTKASQNITYHCSNSVAYYNAKKDHHRKALGLMSWNDLEIRNRGKFSYQVLLDECQEDKPEWGRTILSLKDIKPTRLPIVDVAIRDVGNNNQKFKLEIGQACFS